MHYYSEFINTFQYFSSLENSFPLYENELATSNEVLSDKASCFISATVDSPLAFKPPDGGVYLGRSP